MNTKNKEVSTYRIEVSKKRFWYTLLAIPVGYISFIITKYYLVENFQKVFDRTNTTIAEQIGLIAVPILICIIMFSILFIVLNIIKIEELKKIGQNGFMENFFSACFTIAVVLAALFTIIGFFEYIRNLFRDQPGEIFKLTFYQFSFFCFLQGLKGGLFLGTIFGSLVGITKEFTKD
jgi:uncharacterized membrane protein YidH (DUF202 family)